MKSNPLKQYTIRNIESQLDEKLRKKSKETGKSLNEVALEALRKGVGLRDEKIFYHDLDGLIRSWKEDPDFDKAIQMQQLKL